jgi:hypothetical protein
MCLRFFTIPFFHSRLTALWLSENQHKPLVQLNQETDPETGQRVLSNFMLPQTQTQVSFNQAYRRSIIRRGSVYTRV